MLKQMLGAFFIFAGLVAIAGSAGDCDGKCMEYANTLEEMMMICFIGLTLLVTCLLYTSPSPRDMRRSRMPSSA